MAGLGRRRRRAGRGAPTTTASSTRIWHLGLDGELAAAGRARRARPGRRGLARRLGHGRHPPRRRSRHAGGPRGRRHPPRRRRPRAGRAADGALGGRRLAVRADRDDADRPGSILSVDARHGRGDPAGRRARLGAGRAARPPGHPDRAPHPDARRRAGAVLPLRGASLDRRTPYSPARPCSTSTAAPRPRRPAMFSAVWQSLALCGFDVLVPNVRGSAGYGKRWISLDDLELRLDSVADLAAIHDWLPSVGPRPVALGAVGRLLRRLHGARRRRHAAGAVGGRGRHRRHLVAGDVPGEHLGLPAGLPRARVRLPRPRPRVPREGLADSPTSTTWSRRCSSSTAPTTRAYPCPRPSRSRPPSTARASTASCGCTTTRATAWPSAPTASTPTPPPSSSSCST